MYLLKITISSYTRFQFKTLFPTNFKKKFFLIKENKIKSIFYIQKNKKFNIIKSPFVNKKSKEQFQYKIYKNSYQINSLSIDSLFKIMLFFKKTSTPEFKINFQLQYGLSKKI